MVETEREREIKQTEMKTETKIGERVSRVVMQFDLYHCLKQYHRIIMFFFK